MPDRINRRLHIREEKKSMNLKILRQKLSKWKQVFLKGWNKMLEQHC